MSDAGQKSFEHLIGVFEGSSAREDDFLKGEKSPGRFLAAFDEARLLALAARLARNRTWQCPTLAWERGGNLIEERDLEHDPLARYAPASWKNGTWKRFRDQVIGEFNVDDLPTRKRFLAKELEVVAALHRAGVPFLAGTDTVAGVYIFPGFSLHDELGLLAQAGFTPLEALRSATLSPAEYLSMSDRLGRIEKGSSPTSCSSTPTRSRTSGTRGRSARWSRPGATSRAKTWTRCCAEWRPAPQAVEPGSTLDGGTLTAEGDLARSDG
jgi:hypothetical protein